MTIEQYKGVWVLRDDLLPGGTKSTLMEHLLDGTKKEYVYASPVYGGFQIALAAYCRKVGKKAVIFCAKRKTPHPNTLKVKQLGGLVAQVPYGYLSNCQAKAKTYCASRSGAQLLKFGANTPTAKKMIAKRMKAIIAQLGREPDQIFCAIGSGTLFEGIIQGTSKAEVIGVQVGAEYKTPTPTRARVLKYPMPFEKAPRISAPFPSCSNYDLKAWDFCQKYKRPGAFVFFWNVLD